MGTDSTTSTPLGVGFGFTLEGGSGFFFAANKPTSSSSPSDARMCDFSKQI